MTRTVDPRSPRFDRAWLLFGVAPLAVLLTAPRPSMAADGFLAVALACSSGIEAPACSREVATDTCDAGAMTVTPTGGTQQCVPAAIAGRVLGDAGERVRPSRLNIGSMAANLCPNGDMEDGTGAISRPRRSSPILRMQGSGSTSLGATRLSTTAPTEMLRTTALRFRRQRTSGSSTFLLAIGRSKGRSALVMAHCAFVARDVLPVARGLS
ncbi:hypothetical protein BV511_08530 [Methylorubrum extorquens]|uniref:hypothetical protein n=1 Tax=Methylorubrum extorquens TaxID=408 RepID=UPI000972B4C5|nr:hypothetical protein [Methylorubrum extorquens]APX84753.1 hypothetical protein BV511_08530 [Methylorubrum extorquens]